MWFADLLVYRFTEYTPRENWLGGDAQRSLDALRVSSGFVCGVVVGHCVLCLLSVLCVLNAQIAMEPDFELVEESDDMPLLIREHQRKFQLITPSVTVFKKN